MPTVHKKQDVPDMDTSEAAAYLAEMAGSLAVMARQHGFDALAYIFDMAHEEAQGGTHPSDTLRGRR